MVDASRVDFDRYEWDYTSPGMRVKRALCNGKQLRLVEIGSEFGEPEWCEAGHVGYVLEGELEIHFERVSERLSAGDGLYIVSGREMRHRARAVRGIARLILVEDKRSHSGGGNDEA